MAGASADPKDPSRLDEIYTNKKDTGNKCNRFLFPSKVAAREG